MSDTSASACTARTSPPGHLDASANVDGGPARGDEGHPAIAAANDASSHRQAEPAAVEGERCLVVVDDETHRAKDNRQ
jgi:hypothetical protein